MPSSREPPKPTENCSLIRDTAFVSAASIVAQASPVAAATARSADTFARSSFSSAALAAIAFASCRAVRRPSSALCPFSRPKTWALARRACSAPRAE